MLRVLALSAAALPWRTLRIFGAVLGWLAGSVLRIRRKDVEQAMRAAGIGHPGAQARAMYRSLGTSALELLHVAARGVGAAPHARIDGPSQARWQEALARGRGVVVAASHTGNWDLAACAVARDVELLVVTKHLHVQSLDEFWQSARASRGVHLAEARGAMARAREALGRGGAVAMMIDQVPASANHAIEAEFLGRMALVDRAPAALAAACRAPLVVAASRRAAGGEHVIVVLEVIEPPARPSRAWVTLATAAATRALDQFVRAHPSQWLWLHRRWKRLDRAGERTTLDASCPTRSTRSSSPAEPSKAA
ncbi:MAG TPA: lysophospholipid acyltransferase family protein [Polyangiaceae bacterium]|nr:lysophospholipid acyltransferase family protein [Polyangiaceae bacterium]